VTAGTLFLVPIPHSAGRTTEIEHNRNAASVHGQDALIRAKERSIRAEILQ